MPRERVIIENYISSDEMAGLVRKTDKKDSMFYAKALLVVVAAITVGGLTMLYSTSYAVSGEKYMFSQLIWIFLGFLGGLAAFFFGYRRIASLSTLWIVISVILFIIAVTCFPAINGAHRWIRIKIPGVTIVSIQPSEFAKVALAVFTAKYCAMNLRTFSDIRWKGGLIRLGAVVTLVLGCILIGKDFGTTLLAGFMVLMVLLTAGLYLRYLVVAGGLLAFSGIIIYLFDPMRLARITSFLEPEKFAEDKGYQLYNSLLALGSGNWFGVGFMESRMKARYLPEAHTDFIVAIVGEELGFVAIVSMVALYVIFTWCGIKISLNANSRLGMLLGFGLTVMVSAQAVINLAVISGSVPTKGMPAPFVSYGGSNMIMCLISVGILLSIASETADPGYNDRLISELKQKMAFLPFCNHWRGV